MSRMVIATNHVLSPNFVHQPRRLKAGCFLFSSLTQAHRYVILVQDGYDDMASVVRRCPKLSAHPEKIDRYLELQGVDISAEWVIRSRDIFLDLMIDQLHDDDSPFRKEFIAMVNSMPYPENAKFVTCGNDFFWSCGFRKMGHRDWSPGADRYGELLQQLVHRYLSKDLNPTVGCAAGLVRYVFSNHQRYRKSLLILSDSMCRVVSKVAGCGECYSISGGTFSHLATFIRRQCIEFEQFHSVIIHCGVNDAQLADSGDQRKSWLDLEQVLLEQYSGESGPNMMVSCPIPHPNVLGIDAISHFVENRLVGTGIQCLNLSRRSNSGFVDGVGLNWSLFDEKRHFHINHAGFTKLWIEWCELMPGIRNIPVVLSKQLNTMAKHQI